MQLLFKETKKNYRNYPFACHVLFASMVIDEFTKRTTFSEWLGIVFWGEFILVTQAECSGLER